MLAGPQFQQTLVGSLLLGQGGLQGIGRLSRQRLGQTAHCLFHVAPNRLDQISGSFTGNLAGEFFELLDRLGLRFFEQAHILSELWRNLRGHFAADHAPRGVDNLLLHFGQLFRLLTSLTLLLLLLLLFAAGGRLSLSKNFLEVTHFGKEHVARRTARLPLGVDILRPKMIGQ